MEFDPQDQDILKLLTKLKDVGGEYPENLMVAQRQGFLKRMAEIELGISPAQGGRNTAGIKKPTNGSRAAPGVLETVLVTIIAVEAGLVAYLQRDRLADFFETFGTGPTVQEVTPPPGLPTSQQAQEVTPFPAATSLTPLPTTLSGQPLDSMGTPTYTMLPGALDDDSSTLAADQLTSTPAPDDKNGNNGNHYGQTPKPERTKENNGNNDKPPKDQDDKPPPDKDDNDKPPKDDKPPKEK